MRLFRVRLAVFMLSAVALNPSAKAGEISLECAPDPSSYIFKNLTGSGRTRYIGSDALSRPFNLYIPDASTEAVAFQVAHDGIVAKWRAAVTPLLIEITISEGPPYTNMTIDRATGQYKRTSWWDGRFEESMSGSCRRQQFPTNLKF